MGQALLAAWAAVKRWPYAVLACAMPTYAGRLMAARVRAREAEATQQELKAAADFVTLYERAPDELRRHLIKAVAPVALRQLTRPRRKKDD
jgi:hypothetical protein